MPGEDDMSDGFGAMLLAGAYARFLRFKANCLPVLAY